MFFGNRRVEEELERIKKANLPQKEEELKAEDESAIDESIDIIAENIDLDDPKFTAKDVLAMIIAAFSIILPYALIMLGLMVLFVFFFFR